MSSRTRYFNRYQPYRSGITRRAARQQRAADQQRDTTNIVVNSNYTFDCGQTMNQIYLDKGKDGWFDTGCAAINIYDILRKSQYFIDFSKMYDQFRVNNVRARIIATNWATSKEESNVDEINEIIKSRSYVIVTAWDRSGLSKDQVEIREDWNTDITNHRFYTKIGKAIASYSSAKTKHLGPGNAYEIIRQLYPENNYEKSIYISTSLLKGQQVRTNTENFAYNCYYKKAVPVTEDNPEGFVYEAYDFNSRYPCNLLSDPSCPFKPTLLVNVISGPNPYVTDIKEKDPEGFDTIMTKGINRIKPVTFDVEFDIEVTFRGLRYNRIIDNVTKYIPPVEPLYRSGAPIAGDFVIRDILITESKYNNILDNTLPYGWDGMISKDKLPNKQQARYVVYLDTEDRLYNPVTQADERCQSIKVLNYGANRFRKRFNEHQIFLGEFLADPFDDNGDNIDYLNVRMQYVQHVENAGDRNVTCLALSYKLEVPEVPVDELDNLNLEGQRMIITANDNEYLIPNGYLFVEQQQDPDDQQPDDDMNDDVD